VKTATVNVRAVLRCANLAKCRPDRDPANVIDEARYRVVHALSHAIIAFAVLILMPLTLWADPVVFFGEDVSPYLPYITGTLAMARRARKPVPCTCMGFPACTPSVCR
jgi:hypothetical protein